MGKTTRKQSPHSEHSTGAYQQLSNEFLVESLLKRILSEESTLVANHSNPLPTGCTKLNWFTDFCFHDSSCSLQAATTSKWQTQTFKCWCSSLQKNQTNMSLGSAMALKICACNGFGGDRPCVYLTLCHHFVECARSIFQKPANHPKYKKKLKSSQTILGATLGMPGHSRSNSRNCTNNLSHAKLILSCYSQSKFPNWWEGKSQPKSLERSFGNWGGRSVPDLSASATCCPYTQHKSKIFPNQLMLIRFVLREVAKAMQPLY